MRRVLALSMLLTWLVVIAISGSGPAPAQSLPEILIGAVLLWHGSPLANV